MINTVAQATMQRKKGRRHASSPLRFSRQQQRIRITCALRLLWPSPCVRIDAAASRIGTDATGSARTATGGSTRHGWGRRFLRFNVAFATGNANCHDYSCPQHPGGAFLRFFHVLWLPMLSSTEAEKTRPVATLMQCSYHNASDWYCNLTKADVACSGDARRERLLALTTVGHSWYRNHCVGHCNLSRRRWALSERGVQARAECCLWTCALISRGRPHRERYWFPDGVLMLW